MTVRIVTDSTSDIPEEVAVANGIKVVPAYVNIGEKSYLDGVELSRVEFYRGLPDFSPAPTTAVPSPGAFTEIYSELAAEGAREILSIHLASSLSGMLNAARIGAEAADEVEVTLFDSQQLTMGLGLMVIRAAKAAASGSSVAEMVAMLDDLVGRTYILAILDTLQYLRRSGRVNWAQFGLGTLLRIKPLIKVYRGQVEILERVRTSKRALGRLLEVAATLGPLDDIALLHAYGASSMDSFREETRFLVPEKVTPMEVGLTPAIGVHIGPGGLGLACIAASV